MPSTHRTLIAANFARVFGVRPNCERLNAASRAELVLDHVFVEFESFIYDKARLDRTTCDGSTP
jgi:hypothetical protein